MIAAAITATPTPAPMPAFAPVERPLLRLAPELLAWRPAMPVGDSVDVTTVVPKMVVAGTVVWMTVNSVLWLVWPSGWVVTMTLSVE